MVKMKMITCSQTARNRASDRYPSVATRVVRCPGPDQAISGPVSINGPVEEQTLLMKGLTDKQPCHSHQFFPDVYQRDTVTLPGRDPLLLKNFFQAA
jgi:hypothetical protein